MKCVIIFNKIKHSTNRPPKFYEDFQPSDQEVIIFIDFQINSFTPFIPLSPGGEGQGEGKYQENVKLFI
jgi:hypothetical protein